AALVVPDSVARVSLVRFGQTPPERDLEAMLRWHVRKSVPFRIEDALLTWSPGAVPAGGGAEFVAVAAQHSVIREYEEACAAAGAHPGIVDLATLNLVNLELAARGRGSGGARGPRAPDGDVLRRSPRRARILARRAGGRRTPGPHGGRGAGSAAPRPRGASPGPRRADRRRPRPGGGRTAPARP